jgi:bzd-type benzoyl-CoA reductase Q subunit
MLTMGLDVGSRSAQCVILEDGQLLTYGNVETGPQSARTAYVAVDAAVHRRCELWGENRMQMPDVKTDHLRIEDMDYIVSTGYGRAVVPFAHASVTEISCHGRGAHWLVPGVSTVLDMGGQDCKAIRCDAKGKVIAFQMNDKCAAGTGRGMEVFADLLQVPIDEVGPLSLTVEKEPPPVSSTCVVFAKSEAAGLLRQGWPKEKVLAAYCSAMAHRVFTLLERVGVEREFAITGGIAKNPGVVRRIERELGYESVKSEIDAQIAGALGGALFAHALVEKQRAKGAG